MPRPQQPPSRVFGVVRFVHGDSEQVYSGHDGAETTLAEGKKKHRHSQSLLSSSSSSKKVIFPLHHTNIHPNRDDNDEEDEKYYKSPKRGMSPMQKREQSPRDSMKSRLSPGRPGSRRHQRWLNERRLMPAQPFDDEELQELFRVENRTFFSDLLDDRSKMAALMPFLDTTEEIENDFVSSHSRDLDDARRARLRTVIGPSPRDRFGCMDLRVKRMLQRGVGHDFMISMEERLISHMDSDDKNNEDLVIDALSSVQRLMTHAVCAYYQVKSASHGKGETRSTTIKRPKNADFELPTHPLVAILPLLMAAANASSSSSSTGKRHHHHHHHHHRQNNEENEGEQ